MNEEIKNLLLKKKQRQPLSRSESTLLARWKIRKPEEAKAFEAMPLEELQSTDSAEVPAGGVKSPNTQNQNQNADAEEEKGPEQTGTPSSRYAAASKSTTKADSDPVDGGYKPGGVNGRFQFRNDAQVMARIQRGRANMVSPEARRADATAAVAEGKRQQQANQEYKGVQIAQDGKFRDDAGVTHFYKDRSTGDRVVKNAQGYADGTNPNANISGTPESDMRVMRIDPKYGGGLAMGSQNTRLPTVDPDTQLPTRSGIPMKSGEAFQTGHLGKGIYENPRSHDNNATALDAADARSSQTQKGISSLMQEFAGRRDWNTAPKIAPTGAQGLDWRGNPHQSEPYRVQGVQEAPRVPGGKRTAQELLNPPTLSRPAPFPRSETTVVKGPEDFGKSEALVRPTDAPLTTFGPSMTDMQTRDPAHQKYLEELRKRMLGKKKKT